MDYANGTVFALQGNSIVSLKYPESPPIVDAWDWTPLGPLEQIETRTDKKNRTPRSIAVIESQEMVFVGFSNSTSTFSFDLSPKSGLSMRDVSLLAVSANTVAAFTANSIRILNASNNSLDLKKSIDHSGVRVAAIAGSSLLVATDELYELIDLTIDSKIPLFPTPSSPIVCRVKSSEFMVVQGTGAQDPAMGLIVEFTGGASRQPIVWDSYPDNVVIDGNFSLALFNDKVQVHSLVTQQVVKEYQLAEIWPYDTTPQLASTHSHIIETTENVPRLGHSTKVASKTVLYHESSIIWWIPPTSLAGVEEEILAGKTPELESLEGEEREYANILAALYKLKQATSTTLKSYLKLDLELVLYIFNDFDTFQSFPGLHLFIEELHSLEKTPGHMFIYKQFLAKKDPGDHKHKIESIYSQLLTGSELVDFLVSAETGAELAKSCDPTILEQYYQRTNNKHDLLDLWYRQIAKNPNFAKKLVDYLSNSEDQELVWAEALKLIKIEPQIGVTLFTRKSKVKFDPDYILETLKRVDGDVAWRIYLKHLVYSKKKKVFAQDLVTVVANDLIEMLNTPEISAAVDASYSAYRALGWPKRPFLQFLQTWQSNCENFTEFVDLEIEFANLVKDGTDMSSLIAIIDQHAPQLYVERCAVYRKLGLHNQCLDFLIEDITDYVAALWYCLFDSNGRPLDPTVRQDLAKYALKKLLSANSPQAVIIEHLEKQKALLSVEYVLSNIPESTPVTTLSQFFAWHLGKLRNEKQTAHLARMLASGEAKWCDTALGDLRQSEWKV